MLNKKIDSGSFLFTDWMDLWFSYRRHIDRLQDALQRMEVSLLCAQETCFQGFSSYKSF